MKDLFQGIIVVFAMYSKIPMPKIDWNEKNMKYCICFFPAIGLVTGLLMNLWFRVSQLLGLGVILRSAVLTVIPLAVSGGIHMDGLLDTADAIGSWKSMEERLEIMKDSHSGAFAIIAGLVYLILDFGGLSEADASSMLLIGLSFSLSRAYSGLGLLVFKKAKNTGLARTFSDMAANRKGAVVLTIWILVLSMVMILMDPLKGTVTALLASGTFIWYRFMSLKKFGGITGDVAGFFLQIAELIMLLGAVIL